VSSDTDDPRPYLTPYQRAVVRRGGEDFGATLWASPQSQALRFRVFAEMVDLTGRSILDAGCGRGDFALWLHDHRLAFGRYVGVDAVDEVIDAARRRGMPRCSFHCGDLLRDAGAWRHGEPDVVCVSGTLNTMSQADAEAILDHAWRATRDVLLFNFLSDRCDPKAPPQDDFARRLDTLRLLQWATGRAWDVRFRQDYFRFGHDATIAMRRPR